MSELNYKGLTVDTLAAEIRRVDGDHKLGAGALAEALLPFLESALGGEAVAKVAVAFADVHLRYWNSKVKTLEAACEAADPDDAPWERDSELLEAYTKRDEAIDELLTALALYSTPPQGEAVGEREGCQDCPHRKGDITVRDCLYPDCVNGTLALRSPPGVTVYIGSKALTEVSENGMAMVVVSSKPWKPDTDDDTPVALTAALSAKGVG